MILECPSCSARYLVQIGLFAQGGRRVRCARCKHEWHAVLPTSIDVVIPPADFTSISDYTFSSASASPPMGDKSKSQTKASGSTPNLPAVIKKWNFRKGLRLFLYAVLASALIALPILEHEPIVKTFPILRGFYDFLGVPLSPIWDGLVFNEVKSELKYDSGTMKLCVDGKIHNLTTDEQLIPDIKARALGPDGVTIQSWSVDAPAATIDPNGDIPFHTEVASPMEHTIEDVNLEFYLRDKKANVSE